MTEALHIRHLSKTFRRGARPVEALRDVSLTVAEGEFFALLGPNGAGKSTLIGSLAGLVVPDAGTFEILGHPSTDTHFCRMAVGIVPQEITVDPFFTVRETLRHQSGYYGLRKNEAWIDTLLTKLELTDKADARVSRLSGGMKRRVLIAQALVHLPPVIVLDEPTAGVDVELRHRIWDFMKELHTQGHTIVLTTHYLEEAQSLCPRVALLNHGRLVALEDTKTLLTRFSGNRLQFRVREGALPPTLAHAEPLGDNRWSIGYRDAGELTDILTALRQAHVCIDIEHVGEARLEEVFLKLTGEDKP